MGFDTNGLQSPSPEQLNLARGMDPRQGAIGAGGPGKGGSVTPATPDFPVADGLNPAAPNQINTAPNMEQLKQLIARMLSRGGK